MIKDCGDLVSTENYWIAKHIVETVFTVPNNRCSMVFLNLCKKYIIMFLMVKSNITHCIDFTVWLSFPLFHIHQCKFRRQERADLFCMQDCIHWARALTSDGKTVFFLNRPNNRFRNCLPPLFPLVFKRSDIISILWPTRSHVDVDGFFF